MKRLSLLGFVALFSAIAAGCPIWDGNTAPTGWGGSPGGYCAQPSDCLQNETCGSDNACHSGDCTFTQCVAGYTCVIDSTTYIASCQPGSSSGGAGGGTPTSSSSTSSASSTAASPTTSGTSTASGGAGGSSSSRSVTTTSASSTSTTTAPVYCGKPSDCATGQTCAANGTCQAGSCAAVDGGPGVDCISGYTCGANGTCGTTANACDNNSDCTGAGSVCVYGPTGGVCTAPADQCFDEQQCATGDKCVSGVCIVGCTSNADCRDGYACNPTLGVCSNAAKTCSVTNDCGGPTTVCVGGTCVPRVSATGTCANAGDVVVENGCVPNETASFTCTTDGTQGNCALGSICLHHSCWISCDAPNQAVCSTLSDFPKCKPVMSTSGTHDVCGSSEDLGGECDPTSNQLCSGGGICVDGFCE
jgi:hypothetical protein